MKENIRERIIQMNLKGDGYKKIATTLNISIGSVRNALKEKDENVNCKYCGKKLNFIEGKKRKVYCNDSCRYNYWNSLKKGGKPNEH
jgi:transposase